MTKKEVSKPIKGVSKPKSKGIVELDVILYGESLTLTFREPNKLIYSQAISNLNQNDYFETINTIVKNCYIKGDSGIDLVDDDAGIIQLSNAILNKFFKFQNVEILQAYNGEKHKDLYEKLKKEHDVVHFVKVGEEYEFFIRGLSRNDYKNIFNLSISSPLQALNHIYQELCLGGDDVYSDNLAYVSCFKLSDYLLQFKANDVKKK